MRPSAVKLRPFRLPDDVSHAAELWAAALGPGWPVLPDGLAQFRTGYIAERENQRVGLVVVAVAEGRGASVPFLVVAPCARRDGVGRLLIERVLADLRGQGVTRVSAGSGALQYIWPGVPYDRPDAIAFFDALGWRDDGVATDLVFDRQVQSVLPKAISVTVAESEQLSDVLEFEAARFPAWSPWYEAADADQVIVAITDVGEVVGTLLAEPSTMYGPMLGDQARAIGCVGVAATHEGRGIGTAMVVHASDVLRSRGASTIHIGWTHRVEFYRRAGYKPWRTYAMRSVAL